MKAGSRGRTADVVCCRSCRHVYVDPVPSPELLNELYAAEADDYFGHLEGSDSSGAVRLLDAWAPTPGRLLDVGCGGGRLMRAARAAGWDAEGIEPTEEFARPATAFGPVHVGYLDDVFVTGRRAGEQGATRTYDALTMMAVLEHVPDPVEVLRHARAVAAQGALLVAEVPNAHRPEAILLDFALRVRRQPWTVRTAPLQSPFHLAEFSRSSLSRALSTAGWETLHLQVTGGHNPYPVPAPAAEVIRAVETVGARAGLGLNMTVVARAAA